jgi:hypothetical protein
MPNCAECEKSLPDARDRGYADKLPCNTATDETTLRRSTVKTTCRSPYCLKG